MSQKLKRIARKLKSFWPTMTGIGNVTFSQFGEDIIMLRMLERYGVSDISYLDIGANEPISSSNTYSFYLRGYYGVLIEPNADLCTMLKKVRPHDKVLNFGIGSDNQTEADYYMFGKKHTAINTFSREEAINYEKEGMPIKQVVKLPLKNVNDVIAENFKGGPTIISLDVEGLDETILQNLDFEKYQPLLVCVETVGYNAKGALIKRKSILDLMAKSGYFVYADTHVNTIFCSKSLYDLLVSG
jgi:FkbM family methyltransferase